MGPFWNFLVAGGATLSCAFNAATASDEITLTAAAGSLTLQGAYNNSAGATPSILLTSANNEIQIRAPAVAMGTIFDVQTNGGGGILRITDNGTSSFVSIGALTLTGAAASTFSTSSGALTLTSAGSATWSTSGAATSLTVDSNGAALNLGTVNATAVSIGGTNIGTTTGNITVSRGGGNVSTFQLNDSGGGADLYVESSAGGSAQVIWNSAGGALDTSLFRANPAILQVGTGGASGVGTLYLAGLDQASAAALTIGGTNANAVNVGNGTIITTITGRETISAQNAGAGANTSQIVPSVHNSATVNQAIEYGRTALASGTVTITFSPAFNATPSCTCTQEAATAVACAIDSAVTFNSTTVTFLGTTTNTIDWICIGAR